MVMIGFGRGSIGYKAMNGTNWLLCVGGDLLG